MSLRFTWHQQGWHWQWFSKFPDFPVSLSNQIQLHKVAYSYSPKSSFSYFHRKNTTKRLHYDHANNTKNKELQNVARQNFKEM